MNDIDRALLEVQARHAGALRAAARTLQAQGVRRLHYGVDYVNDDGEPADYAVYEYEDGRVVELEHWPEELSEDVFLWAVRYCQPYTFEVATAALTLDRQGGQVATEENVLRNYHTDARRQLLEEEAGDGDGFSLLDEFSVSYLAELRELGSALSVQGIRKVHFGVDCLGPAHQPRYPIAGWCVVQRDEGETAGALLPELQAAADLWDELPDYGAFTLDTGSGWVTPSDEGGTVTLGPEEIRAYHSEAQRQALLGRPT